MKNEKPIAVYGALVANIVIAILKYIVAFITGSSAMLAEAIHTTADSGNELLLLLGLHRSQKPADEQHPFGHGRELYFWSLIVAIMIFSSGAGMSVYEGVTNLSKPEKVQSPIWNYAVLGFSFIIEGISWSIAFRKLLQQKRADESFWASLTSSKDPSLFIVFGEDTAAIAGLFVAFLGILLSQVLHNPYPDVIASITIGLILAVIASFLTYESKSLLIGETADIEVVKHVRKLVEEHPAVERVRRPLTVHLSPDNVFLALDVQFKPNMPAMELVRVIDELEQTIRQEESEVGQIFIEIDSLKEEVKNNGK